MKNLVKSLLLIIVIQLSFIVRGQNNSICVGTNHCGLNVGNPLNSVGVKLNLFDKNINIVKGASVALFCKTNLTQGLSIGVLGVGSSKYEGLAIGGFFVGSESKINGIGIAGLSVYADTMNGFFISIYGNTKWNHDLVKELNGVSIGGIVGINCETINGLSIGALNYVINQHGVTIGIANYTENLNGIQFGLWNVVANKKRFKRMPFINFNFDN